MRTARELVDGILDRKGIRVTVSANPAPTFDVHFRRELASDLEEWRREILTEAAERAVKAVAGMETLADIRRAVMGEEVEG